MRSRLVTLAFTALLGLGTASCAGYSQNVRAMRQYANEDPNLPVALDRAEDMAKVAELVDRLLYATPFDPGDEWIKELPLDSGKARAIREELKGKAPYGDPDYAVPVAKIYRVHLERVLEKAGAGTAPGTAKAPPAKPAEGEVAERNAKAPPDKKDADKKKKDDKKDADKKDADKKDADKKDADKKKKGDKDKKDADKKDADKKDADKKDPPSDAEPKKEEKKSTKKYASVLEAAAELAGSGELRAHFESHGKKVQALLDAEAAYDKAHREAYPKGGGWNPFGASGESNPKVKEAMETRDAARKELAEAEKDVLADTRAMSKASGDQQTLRDVTAIVSVAFRADLEALAMAPIVIVQVARSVTKGKDGDVALSGLSLGTVKQIDELPNYLEGLKERLSRQSTVLESLTTSLARAGRTEVEGTPGFALKESAVDQVVGIAADSFHINVRAGGEVFFYSANTKQYDPQNDPNAGQNQPTQIKNYNGRRFGLQYEVKPITLVAGKIDIGFDWIKVPNAANLSLGYKTDRGVSQNGAVKQGNFSKELGASGLASEALDLGLGIMGVRTDVRLAKFTAGTVTLVTYDAAGNPAPVTDTQGRQLKAPFQIDYKQIDVGYDFAFLMGESAGKYYIEQLVVGGRYFSYTLPRIMYELEYVGPADAKTKTFNYRTESGPQNVPSKYYMGGLTARFGAGQGKVFSPFLDFGLYVGWGPTSYKIRKDAPTGDLNQTFQENQTLANQVQQDKSATAANIVLAIGGRLRIAKPGERLRIFGEAQYRGELIRATTSGSEAKEGTERIVDTGTTDIFHGPRFSLVGEF